MKTDYFQKEYGSWSVLVVAWAIGTGVSRNFHWTALLLLVALGLLVNSKTAVTKWLRSTSDVKPLLIFFLHVVFAGILLVLMMKDGVIMLLPLLVFPAAYLLSSKLAGEHALITESIGFILLSLAAVVAKYLLTGVLDVRLLLGVASFFTAGVFKVKALLHRTVKYRVLIIVHVLCALYIYYRMHIPFIILLPLIDNIIVAVSPYRVRLKTAGWIEVAKSLVALALFIRYY